MAQFQIDDNLQDVTANLQNLEGAVTSIVPEIGRLRAAWTAFNATFVLSPIGAIIVAVTAAVALLADGLSRFQPFLDALDIGIAAVSTGFSVLADNALIFLGVLDGETRSVRAAILAAAALTAATQDLNRERIANITVEANRERQLQRARETAQDLTRTEGERIIALREARTLTNQIFAERIRQATVAREIAELEANQTLNDDEANESLARAQALVLEITGQQSAANRELTGQISGLLQAEQNRIDQLEAARSSGIFTDRLNETNEEIAALRLLGAGEDQLAAIRATAAIERLSILDNELAIAEEAGESEAQLQARRLALIAAETEARTAASAVRIAIADAEVQTEQDRTDALTGLAGQLGDTLQNLAGDNKGLAITGLIVSQAAGVAEIIVDTARANAAAVASSPLTGGQPFVAINTISAGLSIASAIGATVQGIDAINSAGGPPATGAGSAGASPTVAGGATIATQPIIDASAPQGPGSGIAPQVEPGIALVSDGNLDNAMTRILKMKQLRQFNRNKTRP